MYSAEARKESRGAHARDDFQVRATQEVVSAVLWGGGEGQFRRTVSRASRSICHPYLLSSRTRLQDRDDKEWMKHTISYMASTDDKVKIAYRPVHYYTLDEEECKVVPPVARVY